MKRESVFVRISAGVRRERAMRISILAASLTLFAACSTPTPADLLQARAGFRTRLLRADGGEGPLEAPPTGPFSLVRYPSPLGPMRAYLCKPESAAGVLLPAVVWLTGGFPPARGGRYVWTAGPPENDQSAAAYRREGIVMLVPTVRGTADNPGVQEANFGEVEDVLAAIRHLRSLDGVDPARVYLAGHSTGGTLALLVAAATDELRGVVAFGPVARITDYGGRTWPFDVEDPDEVRLRSPLHFLGAIRCPTWIVEGSGGNVEDLVQLRDAEHNPLVECLLLEGEDHFTPLSPINRLLAQHLAAGADAALPPIAVVPGVVREFYRGRREAHDGSGAEGR